jgi:hypothetical protein
MWRWLAALAVVLVLAVSDLPATATSPPADLSAAPEGGAGLLAQARASLATNNTSWTLDPTTSTPGALAGALLVYDASDGYS